jgi:methylmalonyl-CoA epimerase
VAVRIDHMAVAVRDIDASLPWYVDHLGMAIIGDELLPQLNVRLAYLDCAGSMLQLVQPTGPCPIADFLAEHGEGLHHICLAVDDIPTTLRVLPGQQQVRVTMGGRDRRACFLAAAPNGLRIELTEQAPFCGARAAPGGEASS